MTMTAGRTVAQILGSQIRDRRADWRMSLKKCARIAHVHPAELLAIEEGARPADQAEDVHAALDVWVLEGLRGKTRTPVCRVVAYGRWVPGRRSRFADLELACGHVVRRRCPADGSDGFVFEPGRAFCERCG